MKKTFLKFSVGVDVAKDKFDACFSAIDPHQKVTVKSTRKFRATLKGFDEFVEWIIHHRKQDIPIVIVMEATGVYYEKLADHLYQLDYQISVVLPNKAKRYMQAIGIRSKTDKIDAKGLAQMGAERHLEGWKPFSDQFMELRSLTRHHERLQETRSRVNNQVHAHEHGRVLNRQVLKQQKQLISLIEKQLKQTHKMIAETVAKDSNLQEGIDNICLIKGVGMLTAVTVIAESNGFELFKNHRQLTSYVGYDVVENQSGKRKGKTRISKYGNSHIRRILHMPSFNMVTYDQRPFVALYHRVFARTGIKMKGYVAIQRKLLMMIYTLWKTGQPYHPNYQSQAEKRTSGNQETKPSFSQKPEEEPQKTGRSNDLPALDGLPSKQSTEALFQPKQNSEKTCKRT